MRRLVSVFSSKRDKHGRSDKEAPPASAVSPPAMGNLPSKASLSPLTIPLFARRHHSAVKSPASSSSSTPHLSSRMSDPSHSDGSSNDDTASLSVHTPDDAQSLHLARADTKRSWKSWLPNKRSSSLKHRDRKDKAPVKTPLPDWEPLELPVAPQLLHPAFGASDDDMHTSSVSSFDFVSTADAITAPSQSPTATTPPSPALAFANFSVLIRNSVARTPAQPSPFIQPVSGPIYPRSCNRSHLLSQPSPSLRTLTLKNHLRNRLDDPSSFPLDGATIAALGSRPTPEELPTPLLPDYNIAYPGRSMKILSSSPGIHRWICRPAFEDRFAIFVATEAGVQTKPVSSALAVAALEYSEALDVMVDPDYGLVLDKVLPQSPSESMPPVSSPSATVAEALPMPTIEVSESAPVEVVLPRTSSFITSPSPLRNQHTRDPSEASPVLHEAQSMSTISMSTIRGDTTPQKKAATATTAVKRVVRFAEDDDDEEDGLPLHLLRAKKKREEKAKFLRVEQQRRMREAFEEQKRQEMEALENERKALAAQKEREERDRRLYAEKVRASRLRSEQVRAGSYNINSGSSSSLLVTSPSSAQLREGERNNRASKLYSSKPGETSSPRVDELSSSSSSRPASVRHSSHSLVPPSLPEARSRPPSTYSNTSSEDMRPSSGSRRNSYATSASGSIRSSMAVPYPMYPMWTGSHQSLSPMQMQMPMVPNSFAAFADMPLLPPNAPFMKQSRQSSPSPDSKSRRNSSSQSSERGNLNSSGSPSPATSPSSSKNQQWPNHRRQGSGDSKASKRSSKTMHPQHTGGSTGQQRPHPSSTQSQPNVMRGRPLIPNFSSSPSPWTALPSQNGMMPTAMPVYSQSMPARTRNGTYPGQMGHDWRSSLIT